MVATQTDRAGCIEEIEGRLQSFAGGDGPRAGTGRVVRCDGVVDALAPICHFGDEKTGATPMLRTIKHYDAEGGRFIRLPIFSGNALRGMLRRIVMHDFFDRVGYAVESPRMHHAFFTGGILESTDDSAAHLDLAFRRRVRDALPPLGLLGSALGNQMIAGSLVVDFLLPVCRERLSTLGPLVRADPRATQSVREYTDYSFATRRDDLRAERADDEQATQMLIQFATFASGARFEHGFVLRYASPLEGSCLGHLLALWEEQPYIGGKSGSGYGRVRFAYHPAFDPQPYRDYCDGEAGTIRSALGDLAARLDAPKRAKQTALPEVADEQGE